MIRTLEDPRSVSRYMKEITLANHERDRLCYGPIKSRCKLLVAADAERWKTRDQVTASGASF